MGIAKESVPRALHAALDPSTKGDVAAALNDEIAHDLGVGR
jgi:hypothetical protein